MSAATKPRRSRCDSSQAKAKAVQAAGRVITPPDHMELNEAELIFFQEVVDEFSKTELTPHRITMAALLAKDLWCLEEQHRALRKEEMVITTPRGSVVANPRLTMINALISSILAARRSLALHARARNGDNRTAAKRRELAKGYEDEHPGPDELLAKPKLH